MTTNQIHNVYALNLVPVHVHLQFMLIPGMVTNAMSHIEHRERFAWFKSCSHTFLPCSISTEKHKITVLAFLKSERNVKGTSSDSALVWYNRSLCH